MTYFENAIKLDECSLTVAGRGIVKDSLLLEKGFYRLVSVKKGYGIVNNGGDTRRVKANDVIFVFAENDFEIVSEDSSKLTVDLIGFTLDSDRYRDEFNKTVFGIAGMNHVFFVDENISRLLDNISSELEHQHTAYGTELLSLCCSQIFVYLWRCFLSIENEGNVNDSLNVKVCNSVMAYIDENVYTIKNLREVAHEIGYNYSYISTLFRRTCGITLNSYFKTKRMNEAKHLLSDRKMSISEIARIMNYSSVYAFSKAFKEHFGSSPGHYSGRFPNK